VRRVAGVLAVYLALALVWIYALLDNPDVGDRVNRFGILLSVALVYALLGAAAANWWAVLLPLVTLLLALPAGSNPQGIGGDTDAVWIESLLELPWAVPAAAIGVLAGRFARRARRA